MNKTNSMLHYQPQTVELMSNKSTAHF